MTLKELLTCNKMASVEKIVGQNEVIVSYPVVEKRYETDPMLVGDCPEERVTYRFQQLRIKFSGE